MKKPAPFRTKIVNVKLKREPRVSDHALVRYIERCGKSKDLAMITSYRSEIARHLRSGVLSGATAVVVGGAKIIIEGDVAVTVLDKHQRPKLHSSKHVIEASL